MSVSKPISSWHPYALFSSLKYFLFFVLFTLVNSSAFAQDVIFTIKGAQIKGYVTEVGEDSVSYTNLNQPKARVLSLVKTGIAKIKYSNGFEEVYATPTVSAAAVQVVPFDVIFKTDGGQLKVKIVEVDETSINYTQLNSTGVDKILISSVVGIRYSNGYEEAYNASADIKKAVSDATNQATALVTPASANDIIKLRNGKEIKSKIIEVDESSIKYTTSIAANASVESVPLYDVLKVQYVNGYEEIYSQYTNPNKADEKGIASVVVPLPGYGKKVDIENANTGNTKSNKENLAAEKAKKEKADKEALAAEEKNNKGKFQQKEVASVASAMRGKVYNFTQINATEHYTSITNALAEPEKVQYLDLTSKNLKIFPPEITKLRNVVAINLSRNMLKKFPAELLDLPELRYVWLDENGLQNIKLDDAEMAKLKQSNIVFLSLNNNKLTKIPSAVFSLNNLTELRLGNNQISDVSFDKNFDPAASNLRIIDLQKNKFGEMPEELGRLQSLVKLNLGENNIKSLQKVTGYKQLKSIKLNSNPIKEVSPNFYELAKLEDVDLNLTNISTLPDSVSRLTQLHTLILPGTFNRFPMDFGQLNSLYELYINNTRPTSIYARPDKIKRLDEFPRIILNCKRLNTISITGLDITSLPADINRLNRLESLYFSDCKLATIPNELFSLPNLKVLDLSGNKITQISTSISELESLEILNLQNSPLNGNSLLGLRRTLPQAQINYFDTNFGLNFASKPLPGNLRTQFKQLFLACDDNDPDAFYELGKFFESNGDFGLAEKAFGAVANNTSLRGTGKSVSCMLRIAEIYDDIKNEKSYSSPYKRKVYADYSDYSTTSVNNRAYNIYLKISDIQTVDNVARQAQRKANARINVICNDMADNLQRIFETNNTEIERLIGTSGDMQNLSAAGTKVMNDGQAQGSQGIALLGAAFSIFGKVSSSVKDDKAARLKQDNMRLKTEIANLRTTASNYMSR